MFVEAALFAYIIDRIFGEFRFLKHPVILMGDFINLFERKLYKDSVVRGFFLLLALLCIVSLITLSIESLIDTPLLLGVLASMGIATHMLYHSIKEIPRMDNPKERIAMLVSRDTEEMGKSDIAKASIETYAENLSDGVIAPLLYLSLFGITGLFLYKSINTLDSMVGYRIERYERFGKASAKADDIVNFIPARLTALLIALLFLSSNALKMSNRYGKLHDSPNAGYPISAMAGAIDVRLGGEASYFGKIKKKPYFGEGATPQMHDIERALRLQPRLDIFIITLLGLLCLL